MVLEKRHTEVTILRQLTVRGREHTASSKGGGGDEGEGRRQVVIGDGGIRWA